MGSKFNARSGTISLLGEVLNLCEIGSTDAASEVFDFCDNLSWDVAAGLLLCSLGGVPDPCETRSIPVPSEQCDKRSWDIGAEFILSGVRFSKRA